MPTMKSPLLCELHAHTTWSDGALTLRELCDLYGRSGFDVLAVTDHTTRDGFIDLDSFRGYVGAIDAEARRARQLYDLLVLPGLELTYDDPDPAKSAHVVALGLRRFVGVRHGLERALRAARAHGAALVAAHPYSLEEAADSTRRTGAIAAEPARWVPFLDRFELFNRHTVFPWVAEAGLPVVATGDFHRPDHLATWKTLLPCAKDERAVVDYLRSSRPAFLVPLEVEVERQRAA